MRMLLAVLITSCALAQTRESFEVATIKPTQTGGAGVQVLPGGRVEIDSINLHSLIAMAYGMSYDNVRVPEDWMDKERYAVHAKPADDAGITDLRHGYWDIASPRLREMLQSLLAERFALRVRRETRPGDVYHLVTSGKQLLLKPSAVQVPTGENRDGGYSIGWAGRWAISQATMDQLAKFAANYYVKAPVENHTGLTGAFDYMAPRTNEQFTVFQNDSKDSFLRMLQDIGLRLEKRRGDIATLIVESASQPSAN